MNKILTTLCLCISLGIYSQEFTLKKGRITNDIPVSKKSAENFSVYLPTTFTTTKKWPIVFVYDFDGKGRRALSMLTNNAEEKGYILAASNNFNDSLKISENVLISSRMMEEVLAMLPINEKRIYTAGFNSGANLASLIPVFLKGITGVLAIDGAIGNTEVLSKNNPFHFIGIIDKQNFVYTNMLLVEKQLNGKNFPNELLVANTPNRNRKWFVNMALDFYTLESMAKGIIPKDSVFVQHSLQKALEKVSSFKKEGELLLAYDFLGEVISQFRPLINTDSLKVRFKEIRKDKRYRELKRVENNSFLKENLMREDFSFYLEDDIVTYNFDNLGWWNHQINVLDEKIKSPKASERQLNYRVKAYVNALFNESIALLKSEKSLDEEALVLVWMMKTIIAPKEYNNYLHIISNSAKVEDFDTALFYVEELLKNDFTDYEKLETLENTGLLRIKPEFKKLMAKYLK